MLHLDEQLELRRCAARQPVAFTRDRGARPSGRARPAGEAVDGCRREQGAACGGYEHPEEARAIKRSARFKARRWVVERSHSWMNRFRRILVRWEKRADTYVAMLHLVKALRTVLAHGPRTAVRDAQDELLAGLAQLVSLSKVLRSIACRDALSFGRIGPSRG